MRRGRIDTQRRLEAELRRLKLLTGAGCELRVVWAPGARTDLSGEVRDRTIFVYDEDPERALETLRHEFVDYFVSRTMEPYRRTANQLIQLLNDMAYREKEGAVEALVRLASRRPVPRRRSRRSELNATSL